MGDVIASPVVIGGSSIFGSANEKPLDFKHVLQLDGQSVLFLNSMPETWKMDLFYRHLHRQR